MVGIAGVMKYKNKREEEKTMENKNGKNKNIASVALAEKSMMQIKKSEYLSLVKKAETLRILSTLVKEDAYCFNDAVRAILKNVCESNESEREEF